jgi:putative ABC transport system permease protein
MIVLPGPGTSPALVRLTVFGILKIAYKLLVNDKGKFAALLMGLTFSVFLMIQMTSMFAGMMKKASATVTNTGAKVWVMDHARHEREQRHPDARLRARRRPQHRRRQIRRPSLLGWGARTAQDGTYQPVTVLGLDDTSLFGRPQLIEGKIDRHLRRKRLRRGQGRRVPQARTTRRWEPSSS